MRRTGFWQIGRTVTDSLRRIVEDALRDELHATLAPAVEKSGQSLNKHPIPSPQKLAESLAGTPVVAALLAVVDDVRNSGHYDTCDSELTDAPCSCPRGKVDRMDALTPEKEQTNG
jgi:hypothetical protein